MDAISSTKALSPDTFLKLFLTQMQNQDPTEPLDPYQMVAQLAQLATVQQLDQIGQNFAGAIRTERLNLARGLIGAEVRYLSDGQTLTGTVEGAKVQQGQVGVLVGGRFVALDSVMEIHNAPAQGNQPA